MMLFGRRGTFSMHVHEYMYICIHVYMFELCKNVYVMMLSGRRTTCQHVHVYMFICIHMCVFELCKNVYGMMLSSSRRNCEHVYVFIFICMVLYMHVHMYSLWLFATAERPVSMYMSVHSCSMCIIYKHHTHVHAYICICIYIYIYTYLKKRIQIMHTTHKFC